MAGLTLYSGFGLGTLLMPVFAVFFPVEIAVALTAVVHFLNNVFKFILLGKKADLRIVVFFGVPAFIAAFLGAKLLFLLSGMAPLYVYEFEGRLLEVQPIKISIAVFIIIFILLKLSKTFNSLEVNKRYLPFGGLLSGFFGGLSGHQGAIRSAFLLKCGLTKEGFIATGVVIACLVDMARLSTYGFTVLSNVEDNIAPLVTAVMSAFLGTYISRKFITKVTMEGIRKLVSILLFFVAVGIGSGLI